MAVCAETPTLSLGIPRDPKLENQEVTRMTRVRKLLVGRSAWPFVLIATVYFFPAATTPV